MDTSQLQSDILTRLLVYGQPKKPVNSGSRPRPGPRSRRGRRLRPTGGVALCLDCS